MKQLLIAFFSLFFIGCGVQTHYTSTLGDGVRLLTPRETHRLLAKSNIHAEPYTIINKHTSAARIRKIISGYDVSTLAKRSSGVGLPVLLKTHRALFIPITKHAFLSHLQPAVAIAEQREGQPIQITLQDPRYQPHYKGHRVRTQESMAFDYFSSIPANKRLKFRVLLTPDNYKRSRGFYLSQPYDDRKIPIVMIHGLFSTPETFMKLADAIENDPTLNRRYQIWFYFYPTGTPWAITATYFREDFTELIHKLDPKQRNKKLRNITIIAHSMGGLISRFACSHPENAPHRAYLANHKAHEILPPAVAAMFRRTFVYKPLPYPSRIIFMATPHRGSSLAEGFTSWCAKMLISLPSIMVKAAGQLLQLTPTELERIPPATLRLIEQGESAIQQLQAQNPAIIAVNQMRPRKGIRVHSIIGDVGLNLRARFYTDGVVTYASSHLTFSDSEHIIPSNHDVTQKDSAVQIVKEILGKP